MGIEPLTKKSKKSAIRTTKRIVPTIHTHLSIKNLQNKELINVPRKDEEKRRKSRHHAEDSEFLLGKQKEIQNGRIGNRGLNSSLALAAYIPIPSNRSCSGVLASLFEAGFILRCFQYLSLHAWLPGLPSQTTGRLVAWSHRSSRTK